MLAHLHMQYERRETLPRLLSHFLAQRDDANLLLLYMQTIDSDRLMVLVVMSERKRRNRRLNSLEEPRGSLQHVVFVLQQFYIQLLLQNAQIVRLSLPFYPSKNRQRTHDESVLHHSLHRDRHDSFHVDLQHPLKIHRQESIPFRQELSPMDLPGLELFFERVMLVL